MKALINYYDDLEANVEVGVGDVVVASFSDYNLTRRKLYKIVDVVSYDEIVIINDLGEEDTYTVEWFDTIGVDDGRCEFGKCLKAYINSNGYTCGSFAKMVGVVGSVVLDAIDGALLECDFDSFINKIENCDIVSITKEDILSCDYTNYLIVKKENLESAIRNYDDNISRLLDEIADLKIERNIVDTNLKVVLSDFTSL